MKSFQRMRHTLTKANGKVELRNSKQLLEKFGKEPNCVEHKTGSQKS
jgi:hypothetical protein